MKGGLSRGELITLADRARWHNSDRGFYAEVNGIKLTLTTREIRAEFNGVLIGSAETKRSFWSTRLADIYEGLVRAEKSRQEEATNARRAGEEKIRRKAVDDARKKLRE